MVKIIKLDNATTIDVIKVKQTPQCRLLPLWGLAQWNLRIMLLLLRLLGLMDATMAEALPLRWTLCLALELSFRHVLFETNDQSLLHTQKSHKAQLSYLAAINQDIQFAGKGSWLHILKPSKSLLIVILFGQRAPLQGQSLFWVCAYFFQ